MKGVLVNKHTNQQGLTEVTHNWPRHVGFVIYCQHCGEQWGLLALKDPVDQSPFSFDSIAHLCKECGSGSMLAISEALEYTTFDIPDEMLAYELDLWAKRGDYYWVRGTYYL